MLSTLRFSSSACYPASGLRSFYRSGSAFIDIATRRFSVSPSGPVPSHSASSHPAASPDCPLHEIRGRALATEASLSRSSVSATVTESSPASPSATASASASASASGSFAASSPLPFSQITRANEWPYFGSLFEIIRYSRKDRGYHRFYEEGAKKYGEMFRFSILGINSLVLSNPEHIKSAYMMDQMVPRRESLDSWVNYRRKRNLPLGITLNLSQVENNVDEWRRWRRHTQGLLKPDVVASYVPRVSDVARSFTDVLEERIRTSPTSTDGVSLDSKSLRDLTNLYGFEAICSILLGHRMNVLAPKSEAPTTGLTIPPELARNFVDSVTTMFNYSDILLFKELPLWRWFETKSLKKHDEAWDGLFKYGMEIIKLRHENQTYTDAPSYFQILESTGIEEGKEISDFDFNVVSSELLAAGVDTTSNAAQWVILAMARYPHVQDSFADEIKRVVGTDVKKPLFDSDLRHLKANHFVDEALRLYPVLPANSRIFDKDVVIGGYHIPAFTRIVINNIYSSRHYFTNSNEFDVTRQARRECPFGSKTFGFGSRSCPGQRIANLELQCLLVRLLQKYKIVVADPKREILARSRMLLGPDVETTQEVQFQPRY